MPGLSNNPYNLLPSSLTSKLGVLFFTFITMLFVNSIISIFVNGLNIAPRSSFLIASSCQCILVFILPAWLCAWLCVQQPISYLGINKGLCWKYYIFALGLLTTLYPTIEHVIDWNASLHLPESMSAIESYIRDMEDSAAETTSMILGDSSIGGLISGVLVIGILTGFAEEMFFRAGLQKTFISSSINPHVAIWLAAAIFSFIHFQFFGFVPRMLLGAIFGYIYFYSGSIWVAAFAHAFNNTTVVVSSWIQANGINPTIAESMQNLVNSWWWCLIGILAAIGLIIISNRFLKKKCN